MNNIFILKTHQDFFCQPEISHREGILDYGHGNVHIFITSHCKDFHGHKMQG